MALTTKSINNDGRKDNTPEYYVAKDSEGRGYLAKRKVEDPVIEEPKEEVKPVVKKKTRRGKKK